GNQPGTGGDLAAVQFWQYKDDASGAWGPATSLDSVRAAMNNAGVTLEGDGVTKAQTALDQARTECETGFQRRHPGEGNGDCRVVAVGAATLWAHKALSAGRPLPFGVEVVSRFTVAAPAEEESWRSTSR
ncbi:hypothetical protein GBB50_09995, partial [Bifidobacterium longum]